MTTCVLFPGDSFRPVSAPPHQETCSAPQPHGEQPPERLEQLSRRKVIKHFLELSCCLRGQRSERPDEEGQGRWLEGLASGARASPACAYQGPRGEADYSSGQRPCVRAPEETAFQTFSNTENAHITLNSKVLHHPHPCLN